MTTLLVVAPLNSVAQTAKSAYFLDGTLHNYMLNPAMEPERNFFSVLCGNVSLKANANVGLSDFIYPYGDDQLTTFMNGTVDATSFLNRLPNNVRLFSDLDVTLLAGGWRMLGGYSTFGLTLHSTASSNLPKDLFEFTKQGLKKSAYSFSDINVRTTNYAALNWGYSRELFDGFRVGVNAKYLLGLAYANVHVDKLNVELSNKQWMVESHARADVALFAETNFVVNDNGVINEVQALTDPSSLNPVGMGLAFDLGMQYDMDDIVEGLSVYASATDLGRIFWSHMQKASSRDSRIVFDGFEEVTTDDFEGGVTDELEQLGKDAEKMIELYYDGIGNMSTSLNAELLLGAEYNMPFYNPLSVALLYGKRFGKFGGWDDVRAYINIAPLRWIEASANVSVSTFGTSFGWMLNIHPVGLNLFIGSDHMITRVTPQFIPVNDMNGHLTFGINFPIGERK